MAIYQAAQEHKRARIGATIALLCAGTITYVVLKHDSLTQQLLPLVQTLLSARTVDTPQLMTELNERIDGMSLDDLVKTYRACDEIRSRITRKLEGAQTLFEKANQHEKSNYPLEAETNPRDYRRPH